MVKYTKTKRKYTKKKKNYNGRTIVKVPRPALGFPDTYKCKLRYCESYDLSTDGVGLDQYIWSLNSLYDPNITGVGFQPTYFDQLTQIYDHYRVYGAQVNCTIFNKNTSLPLYAGFITSGTTESVSEDPESTCGNNNGTSVKVISSEGSNNMYTFKRYYPIDKIFGTSKSAIMSNSSYSGKCGDFGTGSSPSRNARLIMNTESPSITVIGYIVRMEITYYAQFERQKKVLQS